MEIIQLLILAALFIAAFLNLFFHHPKGKLLSWLWSSFKASLACSDTSGETVVAEKNRPGDGRGDLKQVFQAFDRNGDGFVTRQELRESLKNMGVFMDEREVEDLVEDLDVNGDGLVDFDEFCDLFESKKAGEEAGKQGFGTEEGGGVDGDEEEDLKGAFDVFDGDGDGLITGEELSSVLSSLGLKEGKRIEDCEEMIRKVDMDGDGMVNFSEFKKMMMQGNGRLVSNFSF
ncbi:hypothetical protein Nepgr_022400 [Nepenthes gracilis]|uniref:EF-hand domain-containing protein n=1 Tax=Nepenthes gracilis TaxID=150966 RepID=A0AAD3T0P2_NEPGR|nr:hypothetical protein Nepgr_022400 [Nepenthes gracilis]